LARTRRTRIVLQGVIIAFVLVFAWIGVLIGLQMISSKAYRFRKEVTQTMEMIRDGRAKQEALYEEASPRFQDTIAKPRFLALCNRINQTLGEFKKVASTYDPVNTTGPDGKTGNVTVTLEFVKLDEKVKATGSFSFHFWAGKWRLLGLYVEIPKEIDDEGWGPEVTKARGEASAAVLERITTILKRASAGEGAALYDEASTDFKQSVTKKRFLEILAKQKENLGDFVRVLYITHTWQSTEQNHANVVAVLEYDRARNPEKPKIVKTEGRLEFITENGVWRLAKYKVVMPEPEVPRRPDPGPLQPSPGPIR